MKKYRYMYRVKVTQKRSDFVWVEADSAHLAEQLAPLLAVENYESLHEELSCEVLKEIDQGLEG